MILLKKYNKKNALYLSTIFDVPEYLMEYIFRR